MGRGVFVVVLLGLGCIPHVPLSGAPCPCAVGATCCEILGVCVDDTGVCPATVPSTGDACSTNADCGPREACAAWTLDDGTLEGPKVCRRRCADETCDGDERCLFTLSDGRSTAALSIDRLCLDVLPDCSPWTCEGCGDLALGEVTTCDTAREVYGCFFVLHPQCGLKCERRLVGNCDNLVSPCTLLSCEACPGGEPGPPVCEMGVERTCLASTTSGGQIECDRLCVAVETGTCG